MSTCWQSFAMTFFLPSWGLLKSNSLYQLNSFNDSLRALIIHDVRFLVQKKSLASNSCRSKPFTSPDYSCRMGFNSHQSLRSYIRIHAGLRSFSHSALYWAVVKSSFHPRSGRYSLIFHRALFLGCRSRTIVTFTYPRHPSALSGLATPSRSSPRPS